MQITKQRARPVWPAKTPPEDDSIDCSRIAKEIAMMSVEGKRQTLLYSLARDNNKKD